MTDTDPTAQPLVVVGSDGSAAGAPALDFAVREAVARGARLTVVATYQAFMPVYGMAVPDVGALAEQLRTATLDMVTAAVTASLARVGPLAAGLVHDVVIEQGRPSTALLESAKDAALLVVGARGLGLWGRMTLGSTSSEVVHHATVPVAVVPCPEHAA